MKKGDKQFDVGYGQGGGGGVAGAYKGPSGGAPSGYGGLGGPTISHKTSFRMGYESGMRDQRNAGAKQVESFGPRGGAPSNYGALGGPAINHKTSFRMGYESGARDQRNAFARQEAPVPKSAIGSKSEVKVDKTLAKTGIAAGVAGAAGYSIAKKKKDSDNRKNLNLKMADRPPKINLRKAYED